MPKTENKILTLKNDLVFKAVYGSDTEESKYLLKDLLNKILGRTDNPIVDLTYKNPFNLREYEDDKESIFDIKVEADLRYPDLDIYEDCVSKDEEDYRRKGIMDVEMQVVWHANMRPRLLSYHGSLLREALRDTEDYDKMRQSIVICITNDIAFKDTDQFLTRFYFMEENEHIVFSKRVCIICIELPKVNPDKRPLDELTPLEICLEYLKYADENDSEYVQSLIRRGGKELEMTEAKLKRTTEEERLREKA
ncbi:MAG: PD-(D/E)XK nuclease family transposase, partial [Firmicutes bacterium]|nr:PD-(D/E)XK nuclease family transposase [Bacillota bacterium]